MKLDPVSTTVHVIDDEDAIRTALTRLLTVSGFDVRTYASAGDFMLMAGPAPEGCLVLDLHLSGPSGLVLQAELARRGIHMPTVFLSGRADVRSSVAAIKGGAVDFLTKPVDGGQLIGAIRSALQTGAAQQRARRQQLEIRGRIAAMAPREQALLKLVSRGMRTQQMAAELCVSERTVKTTRANVMRALNVRSLAEVIAAARLADGLDAAD